LINNGRQRRILLVKPNGKKQEGVIMKRKLSFKNTLDVKV
jgi:hypothetical protein